MPQATMALFGNPVPHPPEIRIIHARITDGD